MLSGLFPHTGAGARGLGTLLTALGVAAMLFVSSRFRSLPLPADEPSRLSNPIQCPNANANRQRVLHQAQRDVRQPGRFSQAFP